MVSNEYVPFRLLLMPCCKTMICWVNPRRPAYCPECGTHVFRHYPRETWDASYSPAWLRIEAPEKATYVATDDTKRA